MIILKEVYREGFGYDAVQDGNPIIPSVVDITATTSQMPSGYPTTDFVNWDAGMNAAKFTVDITKPTTTATMHTARVEHTTRYPLLQSEEDFWLSMSYYFINSVNDPLYEIIYQYHSGDGTGSPPFAIQRQNSRFRFRIWLGAGFLLNQMVFDLGEATDNIWHNFIVKLKFDDTMDGRLTVWKDGQLARCHNPLTGDPWVVPTSSWAGSDEYVMHPSMGAIQEEIGGISVLDYKGKTSHTYPSDIKFPKWGMYKSPWQDRYDPVTGDVLPNIYDPDDPLYVEPGNRIKEFYLKNIKFETRHNEFSHSKIFETLDVNGEGPIDVPDWWIEGSPINIISPTNGQNIIEGTPTNIVTDAEDGDVDLIVEGNLIDTKINPPYSFTINNIPRNDSVIDLPFNGNSHQWGVGKSDVSIINPNDVSYEEAPRGQAIVLGSELVGNDRSYISIANTGLLSEIDTEFTISFYIKSGFGSGMNPYVLNAIDPVIGTGLGIWTISNGTMEARLYEEGESPVLFRISTSAILDPDEFQHYILSYDGETLRWYHNLNLVNQLNSSDLNIPASKDWYINAFSNQDGRQKMSISDFRIYDYAIPEEEINKTVEDNFLGQLELKVRRLGVESDPVTINIVEELPTFTITATATTGGQVSGSGEYDENEDVTLTATPDSGYEFVRWTEAGQEISTANPYIFNAEENRTLVAVFQQIEYQLTVTYTAGGTATGSGEYTEGEQVELTATPNSGYSFTGWYRDSDLISEANPYNYTTRGQADTVQAVFELIPIPEFTITVIPSTGGSVSGGGTYEEGQSVTLSAMPQSGWTFVKWSNEATANPYSFNASENLTISAIFEEVNPEVPYIIVKGKFKIV